MPDGTNNYYKEVVNNNSKYLWWGAHTANISGTNNWGSAAAGVTFANTRNDGNITVSFVGGVSADSPSDANLITSFSLFANDELYDISLIPLGSVSSTVATSVINNVAEVRLDCVAFVSPEQSDVVGNAGDEATDVIAFRDSLPSSSYAVLVS